MSAVLDSVTGGLKRFLRRFLPSVRRFWAWGSPSPGSSTRREGYRFVTSPPTLAGRTREGSLNRGARASHLSLHLIDAQLLSEVRHDRSYCRDQCLYLHFGHGLGVRLVRNNEPVKGMFGNVGLIGHTTVVPDGLECVCGNKGCLEMYASHRAVLRRLKEVQADVAGDSDLARMAESGRVDYARLGDLADAGDQLVRPLVDEIEYFMAIGIANVVNLFEVSGVVLGGADRGLGRTLSVRVERPARKRLQPPLSSHFGLRFSTLNHDYVGSIGASLFALQKAFPSLEQLHALPSKAVDPIRRDPEGSGV